MLPAAPATHQTPEPPLQEPPHTPPSARPLGAALAQTPPPAQASRTPSPPFVWAPALRYSPWSAPGRPISCGAAGFVWPELAASNPWPEHSNAQAIGRPDQFMRPPIVLPPDPLAAARARPGRAADASPHPRAARPEPLWPSPASTRPQRAPRPKRPQASAGVSPAVLAARARLVAAPQAPAARPPPCVACSLQPRVDAAARLLLQPQIVWSTQRDAARALHLLGADPAPSGTPHKAAPRTLGAPTSQALKAALWRGMARARLGEAGAEAALQQAVRDPQLRRIALVHLLPVLIQAADTEPQSVARTRAEGYVNLALAQYADVPFARLCAALLAFRVGDGARSRQMLTRLIQSRKDYGPALSVLAALHAERYAKDADAESRTQALRLCKQNLALRQHRDMALSLIHALVGRGSPPATEGMQRITARYGRALVAPEDVWALPLVVLDPGLAHDEAPALAGAASAAATPSSSKRS